MKPIVYFFGTLSGGLSAYPQDYTKEFFKDFVSKSKNNVQIVLRRKDNLLYYGYVRKISEKNFFGICLCIDCIFNDVSMLFEVFDDVYASMINRGDILKIGHSNGIEWSVSDFKPEHVAIIEYTKQIIDAIHLSNRTTQPLPPADFSVSINDCLEVSLEDGPDKIIDAARRYTNLYVVKKSSEIERVNGFRSILNRKDNEIQNLKSTIHKQNQANIELSKKLLSAKAKQKNMTWVALLGFVVLIFGFVLWNEVLFPSEVTHYETGEFVYYGPLKDGMPHGTGVAIYPNNDEDGRKYYIGNFNEGERQDTAAILFYQDGDYYYGSMIGDKWRKGMLYMKSDDSYYSGTFRDNKPYTGTWYDHKKRYWLSMGEIIYE